MTGRKDIIIQHDPKKVSRIALKAFFNIAKAWELSLQDEIVLLGKPDLLLLSEWRKGEGAIVSDKVLERISYIIGVYKALRLLFPTEKQANAWPKRVNDQFNGVSALDVMLKGDVSDLAYIRRYLDGVLA